MFIIDAMLKQSFPFINFRGFVDLPAIFPIFGNSQLKVLCIFASIILISSNAAIFWAVTEQVYSGHGR